MSPAYWDHKPTMEQQRKHKREMRLFLLSILPAVIVAIAYAAWRYL